MSLASRPSPCACTVQPFNPVSSRLCAINKVICSREIKRVIPAPQTGQTPRAMERPPVLVSTVACCIGWRARQRAHQPISAPLRVSSPSGASSGAACSADGESSASVADAADSADSTGDAALAASPDAGADAASAGGMVGDVAGGVAVRLKEARRASISAARRGRLRARSATRHL